MNYKNPTKLAQAPKKKIVLSASIKLESRNLASFYTMSKAIDIYQRISWK